MKRYFISLVSLLCFVLSLGAQGQTVAADSISTDSISLGEVVVKASANTHTLNTDRFMVTKKMREGVHVAGELLGKLQGVTFNRAKESVTVLGSTNVKILVDSVERDETVIKNMNPGRFDYISIVHQPSGKYAGYDAVINFHTRPTYRGYDGMLLERVAIIPGNGNGKGRNLESWVNLASASYTFERLTVTASASHSRQRTSEWNYFTRRYTLNDIVETTRENPRTDPTDKNNSRYWQMELGADYQITKKHVVSALYRQNWTDIDSRSDMVIDRTTGAGRPLGSLDYSIVSDLDGFKNHNAGLYYTGRYSDQWDTYAWLTYRWQSCDALYRTYRGEDNELNNDTHLKVGTLWSGVTVNFNPRGRRWNFSLDESLTAQNYSTQAIPDGTLHSKNKEFSNVTLLSAMFRPTPASAVMLGGGFNLTHTSQGDISQTDVTPHVKSQAFWNVSPKLQLRMIYDLSCTSVVPYNMRDYGQFVDSLTYLHGNPRLRPSVTHRLNVGTFLLGCLSISAEYTHIDRATFVMGREGFGLRPDGLEGPYVYRTYENGNCDSFRGNVDLYKDLGKGWSVSANVSARYRSARCGVWSRHGWVFPFYASAEYNLPKDGINLGLSYEYEPTDDIYPQKSFSKRRDEWIFVAGKYFLKGGKLGVNLFYYIPLHFFKGERYGSNISPGYDEYVWSRGIDKINNQIGIMVRYRFNGGNEVKKFNRVTKEAAIK